MSYVYLIGMKGLVRRTSADVRESVVRKNRFEDENGARFEANFELLYHGGQGANHPDRHKCRECRNFTYRRISKGTHATRLAVGSDASGRALTTLQPTPAPLFEPPVPHR